MNNEKLTRKQLYDLAWSTPLTQLSKKYSLSDNGLRKICIRMQIPLPTAGHWMRLQFNKEVLTTPLSPGYAGEDSVTLPLRPEGEPIAPTDPVKALTLLLRSDTNLSFDVPERLHTKNSLILAAKDKLTGNQRHEQDGVIIGGMDHLDIKVGVEHVARMLRFADTLLKVLEQRAHAVTVSSFDTHAVVKGQKLKILFREKLKRHVVKGQHYDRHELHPTGLLVFRIDGYHGREWKDGSQKLEYYLPDIIAYLEIESVRRNERDEENRKWREEHDRKEQLKKDLQAQKEKDLLTFIDTLQKAERWHKAANLRSYIAEMEQRGSASAEWLAWAKQKADWYDPFVEAADEMLHDVNRETLKQVNQRNW